MQPSKYDRYRETIDTLKEMFVELRECNVTDVHYIQDSAMAVYWQGPDSWFLTQHSTVRLVSPNTSIMNYVRTDEGKMKVLSYDTFRSRHGTL